MSIHLTYTFLDSEPSLVDYGVRKPPGSSRSARRRDRHNYCGERFAFSLHKEQLLSAPQRTVPLIVRSLSEPELPQSRRQFCAHACQAASLFAVGALLPGCGGGGDSNPTSPTTPSGNQPLAQLNGSVSGRTVTVTVSGSLASPGGAALIRANILPGSFLAFRTSQTAVSVLTAICTHEGCTVDQFNGELFVCPCHNSKYTTGGTVANGPANRALQPYPASLAGDTLTFTV